MLKAFSFSLYFLGWSTLALFGLEFPSSCQTKPASAISAMRLQT